jgi:hypothetical protein
MSAASSVLPRHRCQGCRKKLDRQVFRPHLSSGARPSLCPDCGSELTCGWLAPAPCEWCARQVFRSANVSPSRRVYCCGTCAEHARRRRQQLSREAEATRRRQSRPPLRQHACACGCGEIFTPNNPRHIYLNGAHRMRASRQPQLETREPWRFQGNPDLCVWCPRCRANSSLINGACAFCDFAGPFPPAKTLGGGRRVAVAA